MSEVSEQPTKERKDNMKKTIMAIALGSALVAGTAAQAQTTLSRIVTID